MLNFIKKIELILFYLFIFSIPLEKRHIFETSASRIDSNFIEWNSASLYLSDILLGLLILFWIINIISRTKKNSPSLTKEARRVTKRLEPLPISPYQGRNYINSVQFLLILFFIFILLSLISAINSQFINLSLYHTAKLLEYGLLFFYIIYNIKTLKRITYTLIAFIFSGFFQAVLGIAQYLKQSSFNLKTLGEVDLSPTMQNIAKLDVLGDKMIRAYGTFPHSNVLACFLFIAIIFTVCLVLFILNKNSVNKEVQLPIKTWTSDFFKLPIFVFVLYVLTLGLLLTFSRSAWLALIISFLFLLFLILFFLPQFKKILIKYFKKNFKNVAILVVLIIFIISTILILWPQINSRTLSDNTEDQYSIEGRKLYAHLSSRLIRDNILFGVGPGLFVYNMANYSQSDLEWWQLQPVHNVFLLLMSEHGILGFIAFLAFILCIIRRVKDINLKQEDNYFNSILFITLLSILISLSIIMLFDHYLWTIQQGVLCFWLILGLFYASIVLNNKN